MISWDNPAMGTMNRQCSLAPDPLILGSMAGVSTAGIAHGRAERIKGGQRMTIPARDSLAIKAT
jgi:hypothetical protein